MSPPDTLGARVMTLEEIQKMLTLAVQSVQQMNDRLSDDDSTSDDVADLLMDLRNALHSVNRLV